MQTDPSQKELDECLFLTDLKHEFLLEADDYFINTDCEKYIQLVIITELAQTDLERYINTLKDKANIKEEDLKAILAQTVIALSYLHLEKEISHRDLKPENILLFPGMRIKISDFGLAKVTNVSKTGTNVGTPMFMAPELLCLVKGFKAERFKPDIYSFAATAVWMVLKEVPDVEDIIYKAIKFPEEYSLDLKDFIYFCLVRKPDLRPTITQIAE